MARLHKADITFNLIGRMIMAWNEAEVVWFLIYTCLVHQLPRSIAEAIFKRATTGHAQRELIQTIADVALDKHTKILSFLNAARIETNNSAVERNDIIHGSYHYGVPDAFVSPPSEFTLHVAPGDDRSKRKNVFSGKDLDEELMPLIDDIDRLVSQLDQARHHLLWYFLPGDKRQGPLPESIPPGLRERLLLGHPELELPKTPLKWNPIRPVARSQT